MTKGRPVKFISPNEAVDFAAKKYNIFLSVPTMIKHAHTFKFGHQLGSKGGRWQINQTKLINYLTNNHSND